MRHCVEAQQFDPELLRHIFSNTNRLKKYKQDEKALKGKTIITLFYEPSTRTRLSFESAAYNLGANVLSTENAKEFSSAVKGETLEDTIRVISGYGHAIVMRHTDEGAAARAAMISEVPVINAGDGPGQHPTQALLDMYTIFEQLGRLDNLHIAMVGDLRRSRVVRSLSYLLAKYPENRMTFVTSPELRIRKDIKDYLCRHNLEYREIGDLEEVLPFADVVYMTRLQDERKDDQGNDLPAKYDAAMSIDEEKLSKMRRDAMLIHPLPKRGEIALSIDTERSDPRVAYFRQAHNGLYVRMALLELLVSDRTSKQVAEMLTWPKIE